MKACEYLASFYLFGPPAPVITQNNGSSDSMKHPYKHSMPIRGYTNKLMAKQKAVKTDMPACHIVKQ
ncbi:hypothetical protein CVD23_17255 [Bacillus sp. V33-4]|nr:hypothetical protein CVD23_17255 [Bacillus sp. V33-4]